MIKAATYPICISFLLAAPVFAQAPAMDNSATPPPSAPPVAMTAPMAPPRGASPIDAAVQESVRRQAARITLRQKLADARAAEQRGDLVLAAKLYDDSWSLIETIGSIENSPEARQAVTGITGIRLALAQEAQRHGDLRGADTQIKDVLRIDPQNRAALEFKRANDHLLLAQRGRIPDQSTEEMIPAVQNQKLDAATLARDGKLLFEMGKLDEADVKLKAALKLDPNNAAALYYSSLVLQERERVSKGKKNLTVEKYMVDVDQEWAPPVKRELLPVPNPMVRTNLIFTGKGRQEMLSKLDRIRLDSVAFNGLPLPEVIRNLRDEAIKRDPDRTGINFIFSTAQENAGATTTTATGPGGAPVPPEAGAVVPPGGEATDIKTVNITIDPPLTNIRLADALDAITRVADHPIKYSIEDYAIVFSLRGAETPPLLIRRFKVDPNTFVQGLESVGSLDFGQLLQNVGSGTGGGGNQQGLLNVPHVSVSRGGTQAGGGNAGQGLSFVTTTNGIQAVQNAVIAFFDSVGVNLTPATGKSVFFNDREGTLLVRATAQDLDIIEAAIETLNIAPPQVNIKTKFIQVTENNSRALGFEWYLGPFGMASGKVVGTGGTQPSLNGPGGSTFPGTIQTDPATGTVLANTTIPVQATDGNITGLGSTAALRQGGPTLPTFTGILTDPQFRMVLHALQQRDGADVLNESELTTLSGRQAQVSVVDLQTIVTANQAQQTASPGGTGVGGVTTGGTGVGSIIQPQASVFPLGPTLDVIPYVSADGYTIQMVLLPSILTFVGYDTSAFQTFVQSVGSSGTGTPLTAPTPLPHFQLKQVTTSTIVWDGQTIVLGGLISDSVTKVKDQLPVLGDLPFIGRLFRSESNINQKNNLLIFVTPTIIDPAGNRVHTDDELPFAQNSIPPQKPVGP